MLGFLISHLRMHSKNPKTQNSNLDIPDGIRDQILHNLPPKSLVRFTCVSKSWLSLIKNPTFISTHTKHSISSSNKNPLLLLRYCTKPNQNPMTQYTTENYSLYFDNDNDQEQQDYNHYINLYFPFELPTNLNNPFFWVVGTINGLVCLESNTQTIIIWNPSIKRSITLPKPNLTSYRCVSLGFGFDSNSNDYKVLRLANRFFYVEVEAGEVDTIEAEVYSLNMNSWRTSYVPKVGYEVKCQDTMVFVNGKIHVLAFRIVEDNVYRNLIWVFDMGDEVFDEIELPASLVGVKPFTLVLLKYKDSVAVFQQDWVGPPGSGAYVWVMEEYGVVESWTKIVSFNGEEGNWPYVFGYDFNEEDGNWPYLFGFSKNGELFLQRTDIDMHEIVSFEPNIPAIKRLGVSGCSNFIDYFVESLELLDNANAESYPSAEIDAVGDAAGDASLIDYVPWVFFASLGVLTLWSVWNRRV